MWLKQGPMARIAWSLVHGRSDEPNSSMYDAELISMIEEHNAFDVHEYAPCTT